MRKSACHIALWWFVAFSQFGGWQDPQVFEDRKECERVREITAGKLFPGDAISETCVHVDFAVIGAE